MKMQRNRIGIAMLCLILLLCALSASAGETVLDGTVQCRADTAIRARFGGCVEEVKVMAGQHVEAGEELLRFETQTVYALQDGTVHYFGVPGDDAAALENRYGSVALLSPDVRYTVSVSTKTAFDVETNRVITPGEIVYLRSSAVTTRTAVGRVTQVVSGSFTVELLESNLISSEQANVYRGSDFATSSRLGKGSVTLLAPEVYTATGILTCLCAEEGAHVKKGDALFEVLTGSYAGAAEVSNVVSAPEAGVIREGMFLAGDTAEAGNTLFTFCPDRETVIVAQACEEDRAVIVPGMQVSLAFPVLDGGSGTVPGTVLSVSGLPDEEGNWSVWIVPESTEGLFLGMTAEVTVQY